MPFLPGEQPPLPGEQPPPAALPASGTDRAITAEIRKQLFLDPYVSSREVRVDTMAGIVTLSGTVRDLLSKGRAALIAENTPGVTGLINDLRVQPSQVPPDAKIREDVAYRLQDADAFMFRHVHVRVDCGVVFLSGSVDSETMRQLATRFVEGTAGVVSVRNDLRVASQTPPPDPQLRSRIQSALREDAFLGPEAIAVDARQGAVRFTGTVAVNVSGGEVQLSGSVVSAAQKQLAEQAAHRIPGVVKIQNDLAVRGAKPNAKPAPAAR